MVSEGSLNTNFWSQGFNLTILFMYDTIETGGSHATKTDESPLPIETDCLERESNSGVAERDRCSTASVVC